MIGRRPIRALIADDHALFRRGLQMLLEGESDIDVVGEVSDGHEAIELSERTTPDVVLMDVSMPYVAGVEATPAIKDALPTTKILLLTISDKPADVFEGLYAGASGSLSKEISFEEITNAVRCVHQNKSLISPSLASKLLNERNEVPRSPPHRAGARGPQARGRGQEQLGHRSGTFDHRAGGHNDRGGHQTQTPGM